MRQAVLGTAILVTAVLSMNLTAQDRPGWGFGEWKTVGATGTPDEFATSRVLLQDSGWAEIRPEISDTSIKLRYDIPPVAGLRGPSPEPDITYLYKLWVRGRDNGASARVLVSIKSLNFTAGTVRTLGIFDSDQHQFCESCGDASPDANGTFFALGPVLRDEFGVMRWFKPQQNAYWAEVHLIKNALDGRPGVQAIGVIIRED